MKGVIKVAPAMERSSLLPLSGAYGDQKSASEQGAIQTLRELFYDRIFGYSKLDFTVQSLRDSNLRCATPARHANFMLGQPHRKE
jgi:hypothetical protein